MFIFIKLKFEDIHFLYSFFTQIYTNISITLHNSNSKNLTKAKDLNGKLGHVLTTVFLFQKKKIIIERHVELLESIFEVQIQHN